MREGGLSFSSINDDNDTCIAFIHSEALRAAGWIWMLQMVYAA